MRYLILFVLAVSQMWGQGVLVTRYSNMAQIRAYLSLTDEQLDKMMRANEAFAEWAGSRQMRMVEVQAEIAVETAKSPLNPAALGVRYAEVETIRREIAERAAKTMTANVALLTEGQKTKLKALEEALKLAGTGSEAKTLKLLPDDCANSGIAFPAGDYFPGFPSFLSVTGCVSTQLVAQP